MRAASEAGAGALAGAAAAGVPRAPRPRLRRIEVELPLGAHRVVAEDLPDACPRLLSDGVLDAVSLQVRDRALEVGAREGDVVDDSGALLRQIVRGDVQDGAPARVEPQA